MVEIKYVESISLNLLHLTFADKEIMCLRCHYLKLVWVSQFLSQPARLLFKPDPPSCALPELHIAPVKCLWIKCIVLFSLVSTVLVKNVSVMFKLQ